MDPIFSGVEARTIMLNANAHACQSTPLFSRNGDLFGMLNTHYEKPFRPSDTVLEFLDLLAQQAADFIERVQLHQKLESEVAQRTLELSEANANLHELSARLLQARDEEGRRLARDLHDSVGQLLAAMSMNIATVQSTALEPRAVKAAAENSALVSQAIIEIRTLAHLLHPPLLDEVGLASALQWFVEGFSNRSKIDVKLQTPEDFERMSADIELAIFRVVQEALTNVHRHSGSCSATITLETQSDQVLVTVEDEGRGIPRDHIGNGLRPGIGIRGMQERVALLGGNLDVVSNAKGTRVQARLPLKKRV